MNKASSVSCLGPTAAATLNNHLNHHPHTHPHFVAAHRPAPHHHHHHHHLHHQQPPPGNMLPFDSLGLYEPQPKPRFYFKMPRVVPDQKNKFESDELFRRLSRESEVRYTGYRDRPLEERQMRFQNGCREGHTEIAFIATGTNLQLVFNPVANGYLTDMRDCDFDKEHGKVHIRSHFIMNGVCVRWRGWIDLERLDGVGCLEYDEETAQIEDAVLRDQIERYNQRLRDFEEKQRAYCGQQERGADVELDSRKKAEVTTGHGHGH